MTLRSLSTILIFVSSSSLLVSASDSIESQMVTKSFLITKSTKSYEEAIRFAEKLSVKSAIKLDFRDLLLDSDIGLTEAKKVCLDHGFEAPCYVARGRYDDGVYISVEYSNAYSAFSEGYYIVMIASGEVSQGMLKRINEIVPDAYIKKSPVYMGCMH